MLTITLEQPQLADLWSLAPTNVCSHLVGYGGGTDSANGSLGDSDVRGGDADVHGIGGDGGTALGGKNDDDNTNGGGGPREALCIGNGGDVDACQGGGAGMSSGIQGTAHNGASDTAAKVGKAIASASSKADTGCGIKVSAITARGVAGCKRGLLCAGMMRVPSAAELGQAGSPAPGVEGRPSNSSSRRGSPPRRGSLTLPAIAAVAGVMATTGGTPTRGTPVSAVTATAGAEDTAEMAPPLLKAAARLTEPPTMERGGCHCVFREELQPVPLLFRSVKYTSTSHHFGSPRMQHCHSDL